MAPITKKILASTTKPLEEVSGDFMDVRYHSNEPICDIPATNPIKKPDLFQEYKPKKADKLDYVISQTYCKMDAGCTKINIKQTRAEYEPAKARPSQNMQKKKKKKVTYGRGPIWEFLEEKIARKIEEMQAKYRKEFDEYKKKRVKERKLKVAGIHDKLLKKVGPDWYQELSNQQLCTVDNLQFCILKDLQLETVIYTKENIAELGLVLRPNAAHTEIALKFSCGCPVEFLLILYQVINPKRTEYSLNDRLLLSAVVHLTMPSTLKELHIRIPSPPRKISKKVIKPTAPKPIKKKYESPYLVPFTFVPEPRKFTGIYVNKHVQKPESPYFSYLEELKSQPTFDMDKLSIPPFTEADLSLYTIFQILQECFLAQAIYNKLAEDNVAPYLYMPNIYPQCIRTHEQFDDGVTEEVCEPPVIFADNTKECGYLQAIHQMQDQLIELSQKFVIGGISIGQDGLPVYILIAVLNYKECACAKVQLQMQEQREIEEYNRTVQNLQNNLIESEKKYVIGGVTNGPCKEPVFILGACIINRGICLNHRKALKDKERLDTVKEKLSVQCERFILGGVTKDRKGHSVFIISAVLPIKKCICGKHEKIVKEMKDNRTPVEKSQDELKAFKQKFVISGVIVRDGAPIHIINAVYDSKDCTCGNHVMVYGRVKDKREEMQMLQHKLTKSRTKYVIGGVTFDPNGLPVFNIMAAILRNELCERHQKKKDGYNELCQMHKIINELQENLRTRRTKFVIGGVTYDRKGKAVYILSQAVVYKGLCPRHIQPKLLQIKALQEQKNIKQLEQKFAIGGVVYAGFEKKPVYLIQSVVIYKKLCRKHRIVGIEKDAIDEMQERFSKFRQNFVIGGVTRDRIGRPVYVIQSTLSLKYACAHRRNLGPTIGDSLYTNKYPESQEINEENEDNEDIISTDTKHSVCNALTCKAELKEIGDEEYVKAISKLQNRLIYSSIKFVISGLTFGPDGDPIYIISSVRKQRECMCQTIFPSSESSAFTSNEDESELSDETDELIENLHEGIKSLSQRFLLGGVTYDKDHNPVFIISCVIPNTCICVRKIPPAKTEEEVYPLFYHLESERIREAFNESARKYVLGGITLAPNGQPVFIVQSAIPLRECPCIREMRLKREAELKRKREQEEHEANVRLKILADEQKLIEGKEMPDECVCKEECEKFIKRTISNRCQCEQCKEDLDKARKIFIIDGVQVHKGEAIRVVEGVTEMKECNCLEQYRKKVDRYENLKARHAAKQNLKNLPKQYVISGVTIGPGNKPIYMLSGSVPSKKCVCADEAYEEQQRLIKAPKPFPERSPRYMISGIRYTMDGTVYIIAGAVPIPDCRCMLIYQEFVDRHLPCLELYEKYLEKVDKDLNKYMRDLKKDEQYWDNTSEDDECLCAESRTCVEECERQPLPKVAITCPKPPTAECCISTTIPPCAQSPKRHLTKKIRKDKSKRIKVCKCKEEIKPERECTCTVEQQCNAFCQEPEVVDEERMEEVESVTSLPADISEHKQNIELKRYIILSKIPCDPIAQICILKEALETLAEDGFPLAKLPDCYMLPHFKLWMDMRCGRYWTQTEKSVMIDNSRVEYNHALLCIRNCQNPTLEISETRARRTTYKSVYRYRKMIEESRERFIRQNKQDRIADAREMFPATCHYEFPTKTFRDVYFAYLPPKEEDCFMFRKWKSGEVKNMKDAKRCN